MDNILITSDIIIDTDIGLLNMMREKYNNPKLVNIPDNDRIRNILLKENKTTNPLENIIIAEGYSNNDKKELYDSFMESEAEDIYKKSPKTDTCALFHRLVKTDFLSVTILCKNLLEKQLINDILGNDVDIVISEDYTYSIEKYDVVYTKYYTILKKLGYPLYKSIYLADMECNKVDYIDDIPTLEALHDCQLNYITLYRI